MPSDASPLFAPRSYGKLSGQVQGLAECLKSAAFGALSLLIVSATAAPAAERTINIVALGDSLTAGFRLRGAAAFPVQLETALKAKGLAMKVTNAGVSGDTTSGGLARLDWSVPDGTDAVVLELGANDMLRGIKPELARQALEEIITRLKARKIEVLLCGMLAAPNLGADYVRDFNVIFPDLAAKYDLLLYPFFLDGVVGDASLNIGDGLHPSGKGVARIVEGILPKVEELVARVRSRPAL